MRKTTKKKIAPIIITAAVVLYMIPLVLMVLSVLGEANAAALPIMLLYAVLGGAVIIGVIRALLQRLDEIDGGEEEDASQY
jgi:zinc transporter ZupT